MKRIKYLPIFLSVLTTAALFVGCADESSNGNVTYYDSNNQYLTPDEKEQEARDNAQIIEGKFAEKTSIGGFDVTIKKVIHIGDREIDTVNGAKSQLLAIEIEVTNNNTETFGVSALGNFEAVVDGSETIQGLDSYGGVIAGKTIENYKLLNYDKVETGQTVSGYTCISVKEGWKNIKLNFTPDSKDISFDQMYVNFTPDIVEELN